MLIVAGAMVAEHAGLVDRGARDQRAHGTYRRVAFGAALIPILFAYGGWQNANYVAEEIENPRRNLPLSLLAGTIAVVVIYVLVNVVYLRALGLEGSGGDDDTGVDGRPRDSSARGETGS